MKLTYSFSNQIHTLALDRSTDGVEFELDGTAIQVSNVTAAPPRVTFLYQGKPFTAYVIQSGNKRWVHVNGTTLVLTRAAAGAHRAHFGGAHSGTSSGLVAAPMPGQVRAVLVAEGDEVSEAQPLFVLEAMKMELKVLSPHDGVVFKINVVPGASVEREQILGEIKEQT